MLERVAQAISSSVEPIAGLSCQFARASQHPVLQLPLREPRLQSDRTIMPPAKAKGEVRTWVSSRWKNPCCPGQFSVEIRRSLRESTNCRVGKPLPACMRMRTFCAIRPPASTIKVSANWSHNILEDVSRNRTSGRHPKILDFASRRVKSGPIHYVQHYPPGEQKKNLNTRTNHAHTPLPGGRAKPRLRIRRCP